MYKKILFTLITLIVVLFACPTASLAAMRINGITIPDIPAIAKQHIGDTSYVLTETDTYKVFYTPLDSSFTIRLYEPNKETAVKAESEFLQSLSLKPYQACWLSINEYTSGSEGLPKRPIFCNQEDRADVNLDGEVNSIDYTTCIKEVDKSEDPAPCDINHDKQVSALDISLVLTYLGIESR